MRFTTNIISATVLISALFSSLSPAAFAYNPWQMQGDQNTTNQLAQEGVISTNAAMYLDSKAAARAYGPWSGGGGSRFAGPVLNGGMPVLQSLGQVHREDRQIDRLERDGIMSRHQGSILKNEINSQRNMVLTGAMNNPYNMPMQMMPTQMLPSQMMPSQAFPAAYPVNFVNGTVLNNGSSLLNRLHGIL